MIRQFHTKLSEYEGEKIKPKRGKEKENTSKNSPSHLTHVFFLFGRAILQIQLQIYTEDYCDT